MILVALLVLASVESADPGAVKGHTAQPTEAPENKKICRRETATHSRLDVKRVCMTRAQWDATAREVGRQLEADLARSRSSTGGP